MRAYLANENKNVLNTLIIYLLELYITFNVNVRRVRLVVQQVAARLNIDFRTDSKVSGILRTASTLFCTFSHRSYMLFTRVKYTINFK